MTVRGPRRSSANPLCELVVLSAGSLPRGAAFSYSETMDGGLLRQTCRVERWRGYFASSFFVRFPDGTSIESSSFKWRGADAPPNSSTARAAYEELVERVRALGWEPHADGANWFATEFARLVADYD